PPAARAPEPAAAHAGAVEWAGDLPAPPAPQFPSVPEIPPAAEFPPVGEFPPVAPADLRPESPAAPALPVLTPQPARPPAPLAAPGPAPAPVREPAPAAFELDIRDALPPPGVEPGGRSGSSAAAPRPARPRRALVADDSFVARLALANELERAGWQVE